MLRYHHGRRQLGGTLHVVLKTQQSSHRSSCVRQHTPTILLLTFPLQPAGLVTILACIVGAPRATQVSPAQKKRSRGKLASDLSKISRDPPQHPGNMRQEHSVVGRGWLFCGPEELPAEEVMAHRCVINVFRVQRYPFLTPRTCS